MTMNISKEIKLLLHEAIDEPEVDMDEGLPIEGPEQSFGRDADFLKDTEDEDISDKPDELEVSGPVVKDYIRALRAKLDPSKKGSNKATIPEIKKPVWERAAGILLLQRGLEEALPKISICLSSTFLPDNRTFQSGVDYCINYYTDLINSLTTNKSVGKIKIIIDQLLIEEGETSGTDKKKRSILTELQNSINDPENNKNPFYFLRPKEQMRQDISNMCIAAHIINYQRLMVFSKAGDNILKVKEIFNSTNSDNKTTNTFPGELNTNLVLIPFYKSKNPFAQFVSEFSWGKPTDIPITEATEAGEPVGVLGDTGINDSFNDKFLLQVFIAYFTNLLTKLEIDPKFIFTSANTQAIKESIKGSTSDLGMATTSLDFVVDKNINDAGLRVETSIDKDIAFNNYIEKLKTTNKWTAANTLEWLKTALHTAEGASGVSIILNYIFLTLPETIFEDKLSSYVIINNKVEKVNLISEFRQLAASAAFPKQLADIMGVIKKSTLTISTVNALIDNLPTTAEEISDRYNITTSAQKEVEDPFTKRTNSIYKQLINVSGIYKQLSEDEKALVPIEALNSNSQIQKEFNLHIDPKVLGSTGQSRKEVSKGIKSVKSTNIDMLFNSYLKDITEILKPTINISKWGLLQPTRLSITNDPDRAIGILFPTEQYPIGSTAVVGSGRQKPLRFLFPSEAAFTPVRDNILNTIANNRSAFHNAKNLIEIQQILSNILMSFGTAKPLIFMASPDTQTCDTSMKEPLWSYIDPTHAITNKLIEVDKTKMYPVSGHRGRVNSFINLAAGVLIANGTAGINKVYIKRLFEEAFSIRKRDYSKTEYSIAINTHIRAHLLLATLNLFNVIEDILLILREITIKLHTIIATVMGEDSFGKAAGLFKDLSKLIVEILIKSPSEDGLDVIITDGIQTINDKFSKAENVLVKGFDKIQKKINSQSSRYTIG